LPITVRRLVEQALRERPRDLPVLRDGVDRPAELDLVGAVAQRGDQGRADPAETNASTSASRPGAASTGWSSPVSTSARSTSIATRHPATAPATSASHSTQ
jgi:hypothetical protein